MAPKVVQEGFFTASQKRLKLPARGLIWAFTSRFQAS